MPSIPKTPFDPERMIGKLIEVGPSFAKVNLPKSTLFDRNWSYGKPLSYGKAGDFVVIENGFRAVLGRLTTIGLVDKDREKLESGKDLENALPFGNIQLLTEIDVESSNISGGIATYPPIGASVFSLHPDLLKWVAETSKEKDDRAVMLKLATLPGDDAVVNFTPERLFGRHAAVLGSTGGGKSWTLARMIGELQKHKSKVILFDATGEFHKLTDSVKHVRVGQRQNSHLPDGIGETEVSVPYRHMFESDLFALFTPSGQSQGPKLRAAIKSLKVVEADRKSGSPLLNGANLIVKANKNRVSYDTVYANNMAFIENHLCEFDINFLSKQIERECVWPTGNAPNTWGNENNNEKAYCISLVNRVEMLVNTPELDCVFKSTAPSLLMSLITFSIVMIRYLEYHFVI
jgi:energy-coupling factor transporter ATP-binding protein EcfA2